MAISGIIDALLIRGAKGSEGVLDFLTCLFVPELNHVVNYT